MAPKNILPRKKIADFIDNLYDGDLHAKRVLSLANATLGVLVSASLAVHAIGQGLAQALGKLSKHGVKQVDRLLSNQGIDVWEFFGYWVPYLVGARLEVVVAMDWTSFARDQQDTVVLSMLTGHGRATPLMWRTVRSSTLKGQMKRYEKELLVAAGSCPPAAPTDPGVPHSGTRLLGQWSRCSTVHTVHDAHRGERIGVEQARESFPRHAPTPTAPTKPLAPSPFYLISEPA